MTINKFSDEIEKLRNAVNSAEDEIAMAIMFHESWKPSAYDNELHQRMGTSFATHTFQIIRMALRREMLLALMRLWDSDKRALRMTAIAAQLKDKAFFNALLDLRTDRLNMSSPFVRDTVKESLEPRREQCIELIQKYMEGGSGFGIFEKLRNLRHTRLAHRQAIEPITPNATDPTDDEVEMFYLDNLELIRLLLSIVLGRAFDLNELAGIYRHYATFFWEGAKGERTNGHPKFSPPKI